MVKRKKMLLNDEICILSSHECYEHAKVLKFAERKNYYKNKLRELTKKFNVKVIEYFIADNHVLLLTKQDSIRTLTSALRWIHGAVSCNYNQRTNHCGICWKPRYNITVIQNALPVKTVIPYISASLSSLNSAQHPAEYNFCGFKELAGITKRYRIIDRQCILNITDFKHFELFSQWYISTMEQVIKDKYMPLDVLKNAFAYGDERFIELIGKTMPNSWYSIQKVEIINHLCNQKLYIISTAKKRKRDLLKTLAL